MNPLRIRMRNLRTFVDLDLELPAGRLAILGGNGAGKSTLATAVDWALFGPDARSWAPYLTQGGEQTELLLELQFEHDGNEYRIVRTFSSRGSGKSTLDLFQIDGDRLDPLTRETAKETQALIERIVGLHRTTFRASSMLVQGDGAAFTEAQPRDRKAILADILGLSRWDGYRFRAGVDLRAVEDRLEQIRGELDGTDGLLDERPELELAIQINTETMADAEAKGRAEAAEAKRLEADIRFRSQNDTARALAEAQVAQALGRLDPLRAAAVAGEQAGDDRELVLDEIESKATPGQVEAVGLSLRDLRARRQTATMQNQQRAQAEHGRAQLQVQIEQTVARADDRLTEAARLRDVAILGTVESCPHCGQPMSSPASREHAAEQVEADAKRLLAEADELRGVREAVEVPEPADVLPIDREIQAAEQAFEIATRSAFERAALEERLRTLDRQIAAAPTAGELQQAAALHGTAVQALAALPAASDPVGLELLAAARRTAEDRTEQERIRWQTASNDLARVAARLELVEAAEQKRERLTGEIGRLHVEQDDLSVLVRAYGRDGIPAWVVSQVALPSIEAEACRILAELGTSYQVELRTLRATAAGEFMDALDVIVQTDDGERPYETFSGGERTRINLALRIALARLLATRRRGESRLLVIDEPEFLDAAGTAALVGVIRGLQDFDRIWLISHVPDLRDAPLDGTVEVVRGDDGWSRVQIS